MRRSEDLPEGRDPSRPPENQYEFMATEPEDRYELVATEPEDSYEFVESEPDDDPNTGTQFFSPGTIAGSDPVVLHDDTFRFEVNLATGQTTGEVHLSRSDDAPHRGQWFECHLSVAGTGLTPEGDAMFTYTGECVRRGQP